MTTRLAILTCALALVASACTAENHASIELFGLCAPPSDAKTCGLSGTCGQFIASARPWVYLTVATSATTTRANGLEMFTEVRNQLPNNADPSSGRVNTNDATVTGYELDYKSEFYNRTAYFYPANFPVGAAGTFTPVIKFIPDEIALEMANTLPASSAPVTVEVGVRLHGRYGDDRTFDTGTFPIAVDVYNTTFPGYACPKATDIVTAVCPNVGQTASITCEAAQ